MLRTIVATALFAASASAAAATSMDDIDARFTSTSNTTPSSGAIAMDMLVLRPLGLIGTVLGGAVFVVGLPFEAISGNISGPAYRLVGQPAQFTFTRPIGETGDRTD